MAEAPLPAEDIGEGTSASGQTLTATGVKSFVWAGITLGANKVLVFLATLVLARLLLPRDFGLVAAGLTFISYLEVGLDLGVGGAVIYEQEEGITRRVQTAFTLNLLLSSSLTLAAVVAAPIVARFFHVPGQANFFRAMSLYLLIHGIGSVNEAVLTRDISYKKRAVVEVSKAAVRGAVSVALALSGFGVWSIVWGFLLGELTGTVLAWTLVRFRPRFLFDREAAGSMLRFGLNFVAIAILSELALNSDYLVVGNRLGATRLGYYTVGYRLPELLIGNFFWIFSGVAFPLYSRSRSTGSQVFRRAVLRVLGYTTLFGFAVGAGLAVISRDAIIVLFSAKWQPAILPMTILSVAAALSAVGYASGDIFPAMGRPGVLVAINAPITIVRLIGFILAAPYGIVAVAWVHLACNFVYGFVRLTIANRFLGGSVMQSLRTMGPAVGVAAGIILFALPVRLVTTAGVPSLLGTLAAGAAGGAAGLAVVGRGTLKELRALAQEAFARPGAEARL